MPDIAKLSINLATVRQQWDLRQAVEGCARAGIPAIAPWRDQVAKIGLADSAKIIGDHGGVIEFESEPRRTLFKVMLPVATATEER